MGIPTENPLELSNATDFVQNVMEFDGVTQVHIFTYASIKSIKSSLLLYYCIGSAIRLSV